MERLFPNVHHNLGAVGGRLDKPETLLCTTNFPAGTGFAWNFFESLYARIADAFAKSGIRTIVAYPKIDMPPGTLIGSAARAIELDTTLTSVASIRAVLRLCRQENIRVIYFTDRASWHWTYPFLRLAGVRRIVVYDHTSGTRTVPRGIKRLTKSLLARIPGMTADTVACASDYVVQRQIEVNRVPLGRVQKVHYGLPTEGDLLSRPIHEILSLPPNRPIILAACRATPEKGVHHLLRGFDIMFRSYPRNRPQPMLVYIGSGPQETELASLRETLASRQSIVFTGYRADVAQLQKGAAICVSPSVWQDALPLAVLEAMARGCAVVATRVGGIPEMINSDAVGRLVEPSDELGLAAALRSLLDDPSASREMGCRAQERVAKAFRPEDQMDRLITLLRPGFSASKHAT